MVNNNHLLKPNTNYVIDKDNNFILINDEKYRYKMNTSNLGLDPDGDVIRTCNDVNFVTRFPIIGLGARYETELKVGKRIPNYNKLLKDNKTYAITTDYIIIGKTRYTYELSHKILLGLDLLNGDIITVNNLKDDIWVVRNRYKKITVSDDFGTSSEATGYIKITGKYFVMSKLDKMRLDVINSKNKSNEIKTLLLDKISKILLKIQNSKPYKNGKLVRDFIGINPDMVDPSISKNSDITSNYNQFDILYRSSWESKGYSLGMFELHLFKRVNFFVLKLSTVLSQRHLSTKHIGTPAEWEGNNAINILKEYERYYKEIKSLYKIMGLLTELRKK